MGKHIDGPDAVVLAITLFLFLGAVVTKGLTHDLLLEAGVFLVSVKLVIGNYKSGVRDREMRELLERVAASVERLEKREPR
jgi:hypothetical protein